MGQQGQGPLYGNQSYHACGFGVQAIECLEK